MAGKEHDFTFVGEDDCVSICSTFD